MKSQVFLLLFIVAVSTVPACWAASKIVVLFPVGSKSHLIAVMPIVEELAQRGHEITLVTSFKVPISESIRMVYLDELAARMEAFSPDWFGMSKQGPTQIFTMITHLKSMLLDGYELLITNAEFKSLIESKDIDLFIVDAMFTDFSFPV